MSISTADADESFGGKSGRVANTECLLLDSCYTGDYWGYGCGGGTVCELKQRR